MINIETIQQFFRGRILLSESLRNYTSFRIGGPADYFFEPLDKDDVVKIIIYLQQQNTPFLIIGKGSNLLVSDEGVRGAVVNLESGLSNIRMIDNTVVVDAGVNIARFVDFCIQRGLKGVEMLAGIPGTLGGAIMMNAGAYGGEISDYLTEVEILRDGQVTTVKKDEAGFAYRHSAFQGDVILGASFKLPLGDKAEIIKMRRELLVKRNQAQPMNLPNSGSVFKNPPGAFAAKLIEDSGLKGQRSGKAQISERHANFIVNTGSARATDVLSLIELARNTVFRKFGTSLELEIKLVGFADHIYHRVFEKEER
ncbi:MAG TPA: UDP-N-acetylmuramate dehydrogenase [Bacteroidota bacterium]|nr:UDP-N-acetylmuramate dehydrogenase [Bacteroidota bacterium]